MSFDSLLQQARQTPLGYDRREAYYEGEVRLAALGVNLPPATRVLEMVAPFPKMAIDVLVE